MSPNVARRLAVAAIMLLPATAAQAQGDYPRQPIKIVVGYAPGAVNDIQPRLIGQKLSERYKQPVVIENRSGAGGDIGAEFVARAAPDGYTLGSMPTAQLAINVAVNPKLPYHPQRDFVPITQISGYHMYLAVPTALPIASVKELIAYSKANPDKANISVPATTHQLIGAQFAQSTGTRFEAVLYKSNAEAMTALVTGQAMIVFTDFGTVNAQIKSGKARALAVAAPKRTADLPDVPTMAELGYPSVELIPFTGIAAPKGTPAAIVNKLHADIVDVLKMPDVQERFKSIGLFTVGSSPTEFATMIDEQIKRWTAVAKAGNIRLE